MVVYPVYLAILFLFRMSRSKVGWAGLGWGFEPLVEHGPVTQPRVVVLIQQLEGNKNKKPKSDPLKRSTKL
jgi:hypothetical protein